MRQTSVWIGALALILVSCGQQPPGDNNRVQQLEKQVAEQSSLIKELILETSGQAEEDKPGVCPSDIDTWVDTSQGTNCADYKAHIRGWSIKCVATCDTAARLAEATADATSTCKAFCDERNCPNHRYMAPAQCGASGCIKNSSTCLAQCPDHDRCMLEQKSARWNCFCDDVSS